ncbi:MAG: invasion associated locus B family protein [Rhodobacteraceae bacterium]|nr:invasion associated locus B family protein [Paracoccaceae bacterium]
MKIRRIPTLSLVAVAYLALAPFAAAQSNQQGSASNLSAGTVVVQPEITEFEDWSRICTANDDGDKECTIQQRVPNESGGDIGIFTIYKVENQSEFEAGATIVVPLGVTLTYGLELQIDDALPRRYEFRMCIADGCIARIGLPENLVTRMKRGAEVKLTMYVGIDGSDEVQATASLHGFTDAYGSL